MRFSALRVFLGALGLTVLSTILGACGGGGGTPPPTSITVTVLDPQGVGFSGAYQVGSGNWQALTFSGNTATFSLGGNSKYGVAIHCQGTPERVHLFQATNSELASLKVACSTAPVSAVSFTLDVNLSGLSSVQSGDRVTVSGGGGMPFSFSEPVGTSMPVRVAMNDVPSGSQDLLVVVTSDPSISPLVVKVAKVLRGVNITNGGSATVSLTDADVRPLENVTVNLPSGFTPATPAMYFVGYLSGDHRGQGLVGFGDTPPFPTARCRALGEGTGT